MEPVLEIPYLTERAPAPGRLQLVQRFVNTVDFEHGREMLSDPARLAAVLAGLGLLEQDAPLTAADLGRARALREALRSLALANNGGGPPDPAELELLEQAAAGGRLVVTFDGSGSAELEAAAPGRRRRPGGARRDRLHRDGRRHVGAPQGMSARCLPLALLRPLAQPLGPLVPDGRLRQPHEDPRVPGQAAVSG